LVREGIDLMGGLLDSKRIHPAVRFAATGLAVRADRERVLQVLSNLLGNAIKFTPEGGDVAISVARDGEMIRFTIADSGPGIHPEHQAHVFERYWKHETQGAKGTGLGLFIARSLVDAHGGRIWIESQPGRGATFHFTIPSAELAGAAVAAAS
jgi:signal transduction histidine kinase